MDRPFLLVVAGPNGSGKTTLTRHLRQLGIDFGTYINPDDIAVELAGSPQEQAARAMFIADRQRDACLANRESFSFETVMSHPSKIDVMRSAKSLGYEVTLFFVGVEDPRINLARVAQRVALGGHAVPPDKVVTRYHRTMAHLPDAVLAADRCVVFDNTAPGVAVEGVSGRLDGLRPVLEASPTTFTLMPGSGIPAWTDRFLIQPMRNRGHW
jgi:predicted ABC-type ATPase